MKINTHALMKNNNPYVDTPTRPPEQRLPSNWHDCEVAEKQILDLTLELRQVTAQRDELLAWKTEAIATSERQLVAFQEMQAVAQRKETEKRNLIAILKGINPLLPEDVREKVEAAIAKCEASK